MKEALLVTRALGFQYLWIDALCLVQDDPDDWSREAASMQQVYSNATLTIAPLTGTTSDAGLFTSRKFWVHPVQLTLQAQGYDQKNCVYAMPTLGANSPRLKGPLN